MEILILLRLLRLFFEWDAFPYVSRIHTAYIGEDSSNSGTVPDMFGGFSIVMLVFGGWNLVGLKLVRLHSTRKSMTLISF